MDIQSQTKTVTTEKTEVQPDNVPYPLSEDRAPSPLPGPRKLTIDEYRARQRPRLPSPVPVPRRSRAGKKQRLRIQRRELHRLLGLTMEPRMREQYLSQLQALNKIIPNK